MPNPLIAIAASGALSAGAGIIGANKAAKAQREATAAQTEANDKNIEFQKEVFDQQREDNAPWREAGIESLAQIKSGMADGSFSMDGFDYTSDPGYKFRLEQGQKALDRGAASRGMLLSGGQIKNALNYNQGMASQEYGNAYARAQNERTGRFNRLASVSGIGQQANAQDAAARSTMGANVGQSYLNTGNAIAQGAANTGQIYQNMYGNIAAAGNQGISNYLTYDMLGGAG